jgi:F0F1-type ATP synthase assembly protein I
MQTLFDPGDDGNNSEPEKTEAAPAETGTKPADENDQLFTFSSAKSDLGSAESVRNSGLAWSTGIVLFGSIVLMMLIGWGADLLFGTDPWGMIGGLVIGAAIGFVQLFRVSSEIFRRK